MGAVVPPVPLPAPPHFALDERVEILSGPGTRRWRPGLVVKVTRKRVTVKYWVHRGLSERRQTVPFNRVRHRQELHGDPA
jgi:hypothetical protein